MGVGHEEAKRLTLWELGALRYGWEQRHKTDAPDDEPVDLPDEDFVRARQAELVELGIAGTKH